MTAWRPIALRLVVALLVALAHSVASRADEDPGKAYDPPESYPEVVDQLERTSDLFAAVIAAYQADREWFKKEKGVELTPAEFVRRHDRVLVTRLSNGRIEVQMGPEAVVEGPRKSVRVITPGRRYVIDAKSLEVIEGFFDR
jgi:hypothetical protein